MHPVPQRRLQRTLKAALLFSLLAFGGQSHALLGDLPLVNTVAGVGGNYYSLDFGQPGTNQRIATFLINSNDPNGFKVTFTFANLGKFKAGSLEIPISGFRINGIGGTLGTGLTAPTNTAFTLDGSGNWTWEPGIAPTTETVNYIIEIKVSWGPQPNALAGLYFENINAVISGGP